MIASHRVVRVGDPVASNSDIALQQGIGCDWAHHQIILDHIAGLNTIFYENVVALYMKTYVIFKQQEVRAMDCEDSGKRMMDWDTSNVAVWDLSCHVEMSAISAYNFRLPTLGKLWEADPSNQTCFLFASQHQMRAILVIHWLFIALHYDVTSK